jgi:hypothetical protein
MTYRFKPWRVKRFDSASDGRMWILANAHRIRWNEVFIENVPFAVEYRQLTRLEMK